MRPVDHATPTDPDDDLDLDPGLDLGLAAATPAPIAPDADPAAPTPDPEADADPVAFLDEDLLEPDLGEVDAPLVHDELDDLDEQLLDADDDEDDDDDLEMALLHELGIDLDAPDAEEETVDLGVGLDDDPGDEEVAA